MSIIDETIQEAIRTTLITEIQKLIAKEMKRSLLQHEDKIKVIVDQLVNEVFREIPKSKDETI